MWYMMRSTSFGAAVTHPILSPGASTCRHMHHTSAIPSKCPVAQTVHHADFEYEQHVSDSEKEPDKQSHVDSQAPGTPCSHQANVLAKASLLRSTGAVDCEQAGPCLPEAVQHVPNP